MDAREPVRQYQSGERSFSGTKAEGADLRKAVPYTVGLHGANIRRANLISADLNGAVLSVAAGHDSHLSHADSRGSKLDGAGFRYPTVSEAELSMVASLRGAMLPDGRVKR